MWSREKNEMRKTRKCKILQRKDSLLEKMFAFFQGEKKHAEKFCFPSKNIVFPLNCFFLTKQNASRVWLKIFNVDERIQVLLS